MSTYFVERALTLHELIEQVSLRLKENCICTGGICVVVYPLGYGYYQAMLRPN